MKVLFVVSGGDAPGINSALYHGARLAALYSDEVVGAQGGFPGVLKEGFLPLTPSMLLPWTAMPGSILSSSRDPVLAQADAQTTLGEVLRHNGIHGLILFGGNGTLRYIPPLLAQWGLPCVGIPTTIDNDVPGTETTLGFDSACGFAHSVIDGMRATGHALPGRIFTLETLGGPTGFLALEIARAAGADVVLLPEYAYGAAEVADRLARAIEEQGHALMVYSEGLQGKEAVLEAIPKLTGVRVRATALGHAQRGGIPSHRDRTLAAEMVKLAFQSLHEGVQAGVTIVKNGRAVLHSGVITETEKLPDFALYQRINGIAAS